MRQKIIWRTAPPSGTEGVNSVYVHTYLGSDLYGDGTRNNPYQSLNKAWNAKETRPTYIIAIGRAAEMMSNGNHTAYIIGDYYGAFEFDGEATESTGFYLYGFRHRNIIIRNTPNYITGGYPIWTGSDALAGVGGANSASSVGIANLVLGVVSSPCFIHNCSLYYGCIGGTTASAGIVISKPKCNTTHLLCLSGWYGSPVSYNMTIYGVEVTKRKKKITDYYTHKFNNCIFAKFPMIANDIMLDYDNCLFLADSPWYYFVGVNGTGTIIKFNLSGTTSEERQQSLINQLNAEYESRNVAAAQRYIPNFTNCIFSSQTSEEVFNNAEQQDFTLKIVNELGVVSLDNNDAVLSQNNYIGAMPPAINVPILADSTSKAACWDNSTASGCLSVSPIENSIFANISVNSIIGSGQILSKVISIDPSKIQLNGIFSAITHQFKTENRIYLNNNLIFGTEFFPGEALPIGRFQVRGTILYGEDTVFNDEVLVVTKENTSFSEIATESSVVQIIDPNVSDVVWVRCRATIYKRIVASDGLQKGATYINDGSENISYRTKTIVPGESFIAVNNEDTFSATSSSYSIGILFDDTRVPIESPWVPAQCFGEYFVSKINGIIQEDKSGIPIGSGNPLSYRSPSGDNTEDTEGYATKINKTIINQKFVQFAIFATKYK